MEQVLALRPFVPAKDFEFSKRYYKALGFEVTLEDPPIAILKIDSFSFLLQDFYVKELAENFAVQLLVRDVDKWWSDVNPDRLIPEYSQWQPRAPAIQPWGLKVGFFCDPSGVLWHVVEAPV